MALMRAALRMAVLATSVAAMQPRRVASPPASELRSVPANVWVPAPARDADSAALWLDLRQEVEKAAEQRLLTLFYAVRRIVDRGGAALPSGKAVDAVLYARGTFAKADTIGAGVPCYVEEADGALTAAFADAPPPPATMTAAGDVAALEDALQGGSEAVAIPPDAALWAFALTGLRPSDAGEDAGETF